MKLFARLASVTLTAIAMVSSPAAHAASTLFPDLARKDFPERPDSVALRWVDARPGAATLHAYHWRQNDVGFPSVLTATSSLEPRTGESRFEVLRVGDHCLRFARDLGLTESEACLTVAATTVAPGVQRVVLSSRYFNYQVQLTLVQDPKGGDEWNIVPTGRRGEPRTLRLRTADLGDGTLGIEWELASADDTREIVLPLSTTVSSDGLREAGLSSFQAGMLAAVDLFYDICDFYVNDWVLYREDQIVDEGIPSPEENDPSNCELVTVCGADHDTCTPTIGGFLACDVDTDLDWGGHFGELLTPPGYVPKSDPDWQTGPTDGSLPSPEFAGMKFVGGPRLKFKLYSILKYASVTGENQPVPIGRAAKHVVRLFLAHQGEVLPASPGCTEIWAIGAELTTVVAIGDTAVYPADGTRYSDCQEPKEGFYELHYELDPFDTWDELIRGEENNEGTARGYWYYGG